MGMLQVYTTSTKPPITLTETHVCNITLNTKQANNLIAVKVCITEKSQIIEQHCFQASENFLRVIMSDRTVFSGNVILQNANEGNASSTSSSSFGIILTN